MSLITISPGHWYVVGSGTSDIISEVTEARKVVNRVVALLRSANISVTKVEDNQSTTQAQNLNYLVNQHNRTTRKLDVSIHFNSSGSRFAGGIGTEVLYVNDNLRAFAGRVSEAISDASGLKNRGAKKRTELFFLNNTREPAILIEVCFVNSTTDVRLYRENFEEICRAIANQLISYVKPGASLPSQGESEVDAAAADIQRTLTPIHQTGGSSVAFTSPALIQRLQNILNDKDKIRSIIEKGIAEGAINSSWLDKFNNGTLTSSDLLGLCALIVENEL